MRDDDSSGGGLDERRIKLVCYGLIVSGLGTLLAATVVSRPQLAAALGLGALAVAALVFERTRDDAMGASIGLSIGAAAALLWPTLGDGGFYFLGSMLITAGAVNAVLLPRFYRLGQQFGAGSRPPK
ncbi:MAG: hypothetical protein RI560_07935 [Natronomonas sp.]|uniref:hypothetical protein n=1 Tax=Natronomonas sp. TaxID=2184060 RepID=UPI00286FF6B6|nr:hypothetical protein [Natronomonas sp.]MDR9381585.1 hypothetical protein [Natronomonas sp.]MDR9429629.1 hypothetical protein [Natronomonas sp.]